MSCFEEVVLKQKQLREFKAMLFGDAVGNAEKLEQKWLKVRKGERSGEPCFVYAMSDGEAIKIGVSKLPSGRIQSVQTGNPRIITVVAVWMLCSERHARELEKRLHRQLREYRLMGEWFAVDVEHIQKEIDAIAIPPFIFAEPEADTIPAPRPSPVIRPKPKPKPKIRKKTEKRMTTKCFYEQLNKALAAEAPE